MEEGYIINKTMRVSSRFSIVSNKMVEEPLSSISYSLFYPAENNLPLMTGMLEGTNKQLVKCTATDGFMVDGYIFTQVTYDSVVLSGDLYYGFSRNQALQTHFDGTIAIYKLEPSPTPPGPTPTPAPFEKLEDSSANIAIDAPLFPYIYVQPWPAETTQDMLFNFISYDAPTSPANSLYDQLIPLAQQSNRIGMENLTLSFINDTATFPGPYFFTLANVPAPFNTFPALYDQMLVTANGQEQEALLLSELGYADADDLKALMTTANAATVDQVWQNYFALTIIPGYNKLFFIQLNKILLVWNIIQKLYLPPPPYLLQDIIEALPQLMHATVILPGIPVGAGNTQPIFPLPSYQQPPTAPATPSLIVPYAIGQLKMAKYRLLRYQQGEVAHIQNVLKGEKKKIVNRSLTNTGEQTVQQNNNSTENSDVTHETTNELLVEAQKTVAALTKTFTYNNLTTTYGPPTQALLNGSYSEAITPGTPVPEDNSSFAKLVVNKTLSRINNTVLKSRSFAKFSETEEISASIFNNTAGIGNFRGIYRWVNKVYRVSVHNYGNRFLLELLVSKPAADFIASQATLNNITLTKPLSPQQQTPAVNSFTDISLANYVQLLSYYQITKTILPPQQTLSVSATLNASETEKYIAIPAGYTATSAVITGQIAAGATITAITGIIGTVPFSVAGGTPTTETLNSETGQVYVAVIGPNLPASAPVQPQNFILNATVTCTVSPTKQNEWQVAVYDEITQAYEKMIGEYDNNITRFAMTGQQTNPLLLNNIERSSLYRTCMAMILDVATVKTGSEPSITPPLLMVNKQRYIQFAEEALEWDEMTYFFDDQPSPLSYGQQGRDDSLRPFLQADGAVVFLPVRPSFNLQMLYYLTTGVIWPGHYPFVPVNTTDTQTATHVKKVKNWDESGKKEKHWDITLPTTMQVIQDSSQLPDYSLTK